MVLVVEDDADIREGLAYLLEQEQYSVSTARDGAAALEYLRANEPPCLILLDLMMPGMSGWELAEELQKAPELARIPIVLLSGVDDVHRQAPRLQADGYLRKPVDYHLLLEVVRGYCE